MMMIMIIIIIIIIIISCSTESGAVLSVKRALTFQRHLCSLCHHVPQL